MIISAVLTPRTVAWMTRRRCAWSMSVVQICLRKCPCVDIFVSLLAVMIGLDYMLCFGFPYVTGCQPKDIFSIILIIIIIIIARDFVSSKESSGKSCLAFDFRNCGT
mmetsp:Transcript_7753/g.16462  ORF Transcript_7753/g.16462 Transcript_7753/m.16462 type:complete len:107 (-) Transcript_7753:239-559(-)